MDNQINERKEYYDKLGKNIVKSMFDQYKIPYDFTEFKYDRIDLYFGQRSAGEIKYRTKAYDSFIIEEKKVYALSHTPKVNNYYICCTKDDIYFFSINMIKSVLPTEKTLPIDFGSDVYEKRFIRLLPIKECDFHFHKENNLWKLKVFNP